MGKALKWLYFVQFEKGSSKKKRWFREQAKAEAFLKTFKRNNPGAPYLYARVRKTTLLDRALDTRVTVGRYAFTFRKGFHRRTA